MKYEEYEAKRKQPKDVYVLDSLCNMKDMDKNKLYLGKVTRVEKYGSFVTLNNDVWGLMRGDFSDYKVGDEVIVVVTAIKSREGKIDFEPAHVESYNIKKLTKSIPRTLISQLDEKKSKFVRIDGEVQQIQQTSGPTIFTHPIWSYIVKALRHPITL